MNFEHHFVSEIQLDVETINGKRHYVLPDGRKYKSVTTILDERLPKDALIKWKERVGEEEAAKISTQASRRGNSIHLMCEKFLLNTNPISEKEMPSNIVTFNSLKPILEKNVTTVVGVELPLYSDFLKTAGRTDAVVLWNDVLTILDFKTSRKLKREEWIQNYFIQTTAYSLMFEEIYGVKVPQIAILIAVDHEEPQLFVKKAKDFYPQVRDVFIF